MGNGYDWCIAFGWSPPVEKVDGIDTLSVKLDMYVFGISQDPKC